MTETIPHKPDGSDVLEIGPYSVVRLIGAGGMGTVYEVRQEHPRRIVALKVLNPGVATPNILRRFEFEIQTLARLHHSGIAQVYDAGTYESGSGPQPYYSMELVPGARHLTDYAEHRGLSWRDRILLFEQVCWAVAHGHQRGVIHRDLKPGNILVDASGNAKLIDFGIAKACDADGGGSTQHTEVGQIVGTLQYMAPEQCSGDSADVDLRIDVYSLGVILFELLTGSLPYELKGQPLHQVLQIIQSQAPVRLSQLSVQLGGDLEVVVGKALEKDRSRRYRTAADLADDLHRVLEGEPIYARPPSLVYLLKRMALRNRVAAAGVALAASVLVISVIAISIYAAKAQTARLDAEAEAQTAQKATRRALAGELAAQEAKDKAEAWAYSSNLASAQAAIGERDILTARRRLEQAASLVGVRTHWEWRYLDAATDTAIQVLEGHEQMVLSLAWHSDGRRLLSASIDGTAKVWDALEGTFLRDLEAAPPVASEHGQGLIALRLSPDERIVATAGLATRIYLHDFESGGLLHSLEGHTRLVCDLTFSPDGEFLASGSYDKRIGIWRTKDGSLVRWIEAHDDNVNLVRYLPDGRLLSASNGRTIKTWDPSTGELLSSIEGPDVPPIESGAVDAAGRVFATGGLDNGALLWDLDAGTRLAKLQGHTGVVTGLAFDEQRGIVFSSSFDRTLRAWDSMDGRALGSFVGHSDQVMGVAVQPGSELVASSSGHADCSIRIWPTLFQPYTETLTELNRAGSIEFVGFSPGGRRAVIVWGSGRVRIWDVALGQSVCDLQCIPGEEEGAVVRLENAALGPHGSFLYLPSLEQGLLRVDLRTGVSTPIVSAEDSEGYTDLCFSQDGERMAFFGASHWIQMFERGEEQGDWLPPVKVAVPPVMEEGRVGGRASVGSFDEPSESGAASDDDGPRVSEAQFDPNTGELLVADGEGAIWRMDSSQEGGQLLWQGLRGVRTFVIDADGLTLYIALLESQTDGQEDTLVRLDLHDPRSPAQFTGHNRRIEDLALSPDGRLLASVSYDRTLRLWETQSGNEVFAAVHPKEVTCVTWDFQGRRILTGMEYYGQTMLRDSEPVRQRYQERQEALAHRELLAPLVHKWMDEDPSPAAMVQRLREAHLLTPQQRSIVELLMLELLSSASGDALELDGR